MSASAVLVVSLDSKPDEALFLQEQIQAAGIRVVLLDFGIQAGPTVTADIGAAEVARRGGGSLQALRADHKRDVALDVMAQGATAILAEMQAHGKLAGVISVGGSGGTTVGTAPVARSVTGATTPPAIRTRTGMNRPGW